MLPKFRKALTRAQLEELGEQLRAAKKTVPAKPA
jgi:hypothetical protein